MSLGFGKVSPDAWAKLKKSGDADEVPPGDYFVEFVNMRTIDPSKNDKGIGTFILVFETTDDNEEGMRGKNLEGRYSFHPNPAASAKPEGYEKMNEITQQNLIQLVDRCGMEPIETPEGALDIIASVNQLKAMKPNLVVKVTHRVVDGKTYQDVGSFRPAS